MNKILANAVAQSKFKPKYKKKIGTIWGSIDYKFKNTPGWSNFMVLIMYVI